MSTARVKALTGDWDCSVRIYWAQEEANAARVLPVPARSQETRYYQGVGNRPSKLESVECLDRGNEYLGGQLLLRRCSRIVDIMFDAVVIPKRDLSLGNDLKNAPRCCG